MVVSSTTATGLARARQLYPNHTVFRYPLDFSFVIRRLFHRIRPSAIVLMELEVWPNLIDMAHARRIPTLIANGRVTEEGTMRRFRLPALRWLARRMFARLRWIGAQDERYASRFIELGARPDAVHVIGSLKYDTAAIDDQTPGQDELAEQMGIDRGPAFVGLREHRPRRRGVDPRRVQQACARTAPTCSLRSSPRKPERFDEVSRLIVTRGYACLRRSTGSPTLPAETVEPQPVFLGDTMGELRKFYGLATVVFVGRSLAPMGGSDVMEVAGLAKPFLIGPHTENFAEAV